MIGPIYQSESLFARTANKAEFIAADDNSILSDSYALMKYSRSLSAKGCSQFATDEGAANGDLPGVIWCALTTQIP